MDEFYNPSAAYTVARETREKYEAARHDIAKVIGAVPTEITITAGATESINLALKSFTNILATSIEHPAVLSCAGNNLIKVDKNGRVDLKDLKSKVTDKTELISIGYANSEIGVIQPIKEIAELVRSIRQERVERGIITSLYLHTDASAVAGYLDLSVTRLGVDLMTLSAAKCYGPKQIGCLYVRTGVKLNPVNCGGGQESGLRSGTENVAGTIGFATALQLAEKKRKSEVKRLAILRDDLEKHILKTFARQGVQINGHKRYRLPGLLNFSIPELDGERAVFALDFAGACVSTGSACAANKGLRSHVLTAIGLSDDLADGSLRISLGRQTTSEDIKKFTVILDETIKRELKIASQTTKGAVFVGMSGGVDSSLSAALLKEQGHKVVGVYMKNWTQDMPGVKCPWAEDLADAKRVATQLCIPFRVYDLQNEYKDKVVDYMIAEYTAGRTPNPDILCNSEIKFKLFLELALADGAGQIATGHYAQIGDGELLKAADEDKDQTYFLHRVSREALKKTIFPIGHFTKAEVRAEAAKRDLATAQRKESMGICFVGNVGIKEFLSQYVDSKPGSIIDDKTGNTIGQHDGAIFYTFGQRHGLNLGGGLPYYVIGKNIAKNEVYVSRDLNNDNFWRTELTITDAFFRDEIDESKTYQARVRHRAKFVDVRISQITKGTYLVKFLNPERVVAPGQSIVLYDSPVCVGGGIVL